MQDLPTFLCDETLPSRGQPNHNYTYPGVFRLYSGTVSSCLRTCSQRPGLRPHEFALGCTTKVRSVLLAILNWTLGDRGRCWVCRRHIRGYSDCVGLYYGCIGYSKEAFRDGLLSRAAKTKQESGLAAVN